MTGWDIGDVVVCVNGSFTTGEAGLIPHRPVMGAVYTVRGFGAGRRGLGLLLHELKNPLISVCSPRLPQRGVWQEEPCFLVSRFRKGAGPGIEQLRALLTTEEVPA